MTWGDVIEDKALIQPYILKELADMFNCTDCDNLSSPDYDNLDMEKLILSISALHMHR